MGFGWSLVLLPILALPFQRRIVGCLSRHHNMLNLASGILLIAVGIFGILTELVPQYRPDFYLNQSTQLLYWLIVAIVTVASAVIYQSKNNPKRDSLENPA